ncbi:hypothetical protein [Actinomadura sp. HBU206391]|uniref:hypothetical protein n=1 Tax=Actinomadura sp. HBU206391 TaxID=2731692 RepID=UPI00164FC7FD|nr:hypothetical protein [Actinomadura sp. HBU206391]MBC6463479.1 hypothetical protein [Actinomadura sp. HBU206391]
MLQFVVEDLLPSSAGDGRAYQIPVAGTDTRPRIRPDEMKGSDAPLLAPVVRSRTTGTYAFLLGWEQRPDRSWTARIAWLQKEGVTWRVVDLLVQADEINPVEGQDYSEVPRRYEEPNF